MTPLLRLSMTIVSAVATLYFVFWTVGAMLSAFRSPVPVQTAASLLAAAAAARFIWTRTASLPRSASTAIMVGALVSGGIAFSIGFFGPVILLPSSNQGPLVGIFITGPLGFLIGGIGGAVYWCACRSDEAHPRDP